MDYKNILPPGATRRPKFNVAAAPVPAPTPAPVPPASAPALAREPIPGSCASAPLDLSVGDGWVHAPWEWYDEGEDEED